MTSIIKATLISIFVPLTVGTSLAYTGHSRHGHDGFCRGDFIVLLGFLALIGLITTLVLAYKKTGSRKGTRVWHKNIAIITICIATLHAVFALFFH